MPINRNTLLRYKTIDRMLRKGRKVTLDELIDACNDALYETNGYGEVSRRTIQLKGVPKQVVCVWQEA